VEVLSIVASSWPIAVMFIALCVAGITLYVINWIKRENREDKAMRAAQAREIATYPGNQRD
jgi:NADH:ubiquinone oxidoreductase subunit 2 (subunit N)